MTRDTIVYMLEPGNHQNWDDFVHAHPKSTFFHLAKWQKIIEDVFGHTTYYLYTKSQGEITGILPLTHIHSKFFGNGLISNAFCVSGGPLCTNDEALQELMAYSEAIREKIGANYVEFRNSERLYPLLPVKDDLYFSFKRPINQDPEVNLTDIPRKQRAVLRKAFERNDLITTLDDNIEDFYRIFSTSIRNLGTPAFPKKLFQSLFTEFSRDQVRIMTTSHETDGKLSSVINFYFKGTVLPYYGGGLPKARLYGAYDFLYWNVMEDARKRSMTMFDFGRSKKDTGPYNYKKNWGFEPQALQYEYLLGPGVEIPNVNPLNPKYQLFIKAWKMMPVCLANQIGPHIVKNLG